VYLYDVLNDGIVATEYLNSVKYEESLLK